MRDLVTLSHSKLKNLLVIDATHALEVTSDTRFHDIPKSTDRFFTAQA